MLGEPIRKNFDGLMCQPLVFDLSTDAGNRILQSLRRSLHPLDRSIGIELELFGQLAPLPCGDLVKESGIDRGKGIVSNEERYAGS